MSSEKSEGKIRKIEIFEREKNETKFSSSFINFLSMSWPCLIAELLYFFLSLFLSLTLFPPVFPLHIGWRKEKLLFKGEKNVFLSFSVENSFRNSLTRHKKSPNCSAERGQVEKSITALQFIVSSCFLAQQHHARLHIA